jgi:hypothetical protein
MASTDGRELHRLMRVLHGEEDGLKCGNCEHLKRYSQNATWFKCHKSRVTGSVASDWRRKWPACGIFKRREAIYGPEGAESPR